jgi:hypothetical protein
LIAVAFRGQQVRVQLCWTNGDALLIGSGLSAGVKP